MEFETFEVSIAVLAESHNPTLLHPLFLSSRKIVPEHWQEISEQTICSLPLSVVQYGNRVSLQVEPLKLLIRQQDIPAEYASSVVPEIAKKYVSALPEVKYTATGTNFHAFAMLEEPSSRLIASFLNCSNWTGEDKKLSSGGIKLVYEIPGSRLTVTLDPGIRDGSGRQHSGLIVRANYHSSIAVDPGRQSYESVVEALNKFNHYAEDFNQRVSRLLETLEPSDA